MEYHLSYNLDQQNERWDVALSGEVDIFNSEDLKRELLNLINMRDAHLYLNCKDLLFIDSTGLGALVAVMKGVKANGRDIHLVSPKPNVLKLFRITNLDTVFEIEGGTEDA